MKTIYLFALIFIGGCVGGVTSPHIELSTSSFDLGDIDPDQGLREESFYVRNTGTAPLEISSISTSCGCTDAKVESETIPAGGETKLTITYDPSVHPGLVGKIKRIVYIQSNDPLQEEIELELIGYSLSSSDAEVDDHDEEYEGLLQEFEVSPPQLRKNIESSKPFKLLDVREDFEYEENHLEGTMLLSVDKISQSELDKLGLKKDDEIVVYCRSGRRSARAYNIMTSLGYTNVKSLYGGIVHWMEDGYPVERGKIYMDILEGE